LKSIDCSTTRAAEGIVINCVRSLTFRPIAGSICQSIKGIRTHTSIHPRLVSRGLLNA
jgi:hypothetical protein